MFCAKCGAELNGAAFCAGCGTEANASRAVPIQPAPNSSQTPYGAPMPPPTNGLAIAGFVVSVTFCFSPVGFILSLVSLNQIKKSATPVGGQGLAIAGAIIGGLGLVYYVFLAIFAIGLASNGIYYSSL